MTTTVDLPPKLLESVDHQAQVLGLSRDRYIIRVLEQALTSETHWSDRFVQELAAARKDDESRQALEEMLSIVAATRSRKLPPKL